VLLIGDGRRLNAGNVNLLRPTTVQFVTLIVHLCRAKLTTSCNDRRVSAEFSESRDGDKVPEESALILEIPEFPLKQCGVGLTKPPRQNHLDPLNRFDTMPACDGHVEDRQTPYNS